MIHLFASNLRPLYEQEVRDILAAPMGQTRRLRYLSQYVSPGTLAKWQNLVGTAVIVNFSLQQAAEYHDPAFIPVRTGTVTSTSAEGNVRFIEFSLGEYIGLPVPGHEGRNQAGWVRHYAEYLEAKGIDRPYRYWVSEGANILEDGSAPVDSYSDATALLERAAIYLQATDSFKSTRFVRFLRLNAKGDRDAEEAVQFNVDEQVFPLKSGMTYQLELLHTFPGEVTTRGKFNLDADGSIVGIIGRPEFVVASRYDRITIGLHTTVSPTHEIRESVIIVEPADGVIGPTIRLPVRVYPQQGRALAIAAGTTLALGALGTPAFLSNEYFLLKLTLLVSGALATGLLRVYGLGVGR